MIFPTLSIAQDFSSCHDNIPTQECDNIAVITDAVTVGGTSIFCEDFQNICSKDSILIRQAKILDSRVGLVLN